MDKRKIGEAVAFTVLLAAFLGCQSTAPAAGGGPHSRAEADVHRIDPRGSKPPASCTPEINRQLAAVIDAGSSQPVDNVMVCGVTVSSSVPSLEARTAITRSCRCE